MKCQICNNRAATVHLTDNLGGKSGNPLHICKACAKEIPVNKKSLSGKKKAKKKNSRISKKTGSKPKGVQKSKATSKLKRKVQKKSTPETKSKLKSKSNTKSKAKIKSNSKLKANPKAKSKLKPKVKSPKKSKLKSESPLKPKPKSKIKKAKIIKKPQKMIESESSLGSINKLLNEVSLTSHKITRNLLPSEAKDEYKKIIQNMLKSGTEITCRVCNYSLLEFRQSGKLKCAHCYDAFALLLEPILLHFQGNIKHYGLSPAYYRQNKEIEDEITVSIDKLEVELQDQIKIENYEAAEVLKNQINKLKSKTPQSKKNK